MTETAIRSVDEAGRSGGSLVLIEHVAATDRPERLKWQRRLEPIWKRVAGNCHFTRTTGEAVSQRFDADLTRESMRKASPLVRASVRGVATKRS